MKRAPIHPGIILNLTRWQLSKLRAEVAAGKDPGEIAARRLKAGSLLSREQAAEILGVSTKKLQRMEAARQLRRCPGLTGVVRYAAGDVLRLASANGRED